MNFSFSSITLVSAPDEKSVPAHQNLGSIFISRGQFVFSSDGHTRAPVIFAIASIAKKQQTKDSAKVRIVLANGGAFVFSCRSIDIKDELISALNSLSIESSSSSSSSNTSSSSSSSSSTSKLLTISGNLDSDQKQPGGSIETKSNHPPKNISITSDQSLGNEEEVRIMKTEIRKRDTELNAKFIELVGGKVVTEEDFWNAPRNRAALVDEFLRRSKKGWDSVMVDDLRPVEQSAGKSTFMVDRAYKDSTFGREPKIREAFAEYVPPKLTEVEFWRRYISAKQVRKKLEAEAEAVGEFRSNDGASRIISGSIRQLGGTTIDARSVAPEQFFDLYQRGILDVGGGSDSMSAGRSLKRQVIMKKSTIGEIDPTIDLLATEEESLRGRTHEERAGYGLGAREVDEGGVQPGEEAQLSLLMTTGGGAGGSSGSGGGGGGGERGAYNSSRWAEIEATRKRKREASQTIESVNDHSTRVVASSKTSVRMDKHNDSRKRIRPMEASTLDDFPDLYSEQRAESDEINSLAELNASSETFRAALAVNSNPEATSVPTEISQSGWSLVAGSEDEVLSWDAPLPQALQPLGEESKAATSSVFSDISIPVFQSPLEIFRKGVKQARTVMLDVTRKANDLFYAQSRSKTGFSDKVPHAWQAYIIARYRNNNELMLHLWNSFSTVASKVGTEIETSSMLDRGRRVLSAIEAQHDEIERLKREVEKKGVQFNPPNIAQIGWSQNTLPLTGDDAERVKSEVISVLILLQLYLEKSIEWAKTKL